MTYNKTRLWNGTIYYVVHVWCIHGLNSLVAEFIFRAGIMYTSIDDENGPKLKSNMFSLSGDGFFGAVGRSLNLGEPNFHSCLRMPLRRT